MQRGMARGFDSVSLRYSSGSTRLTAAVWHSGREWASSAFASLNLTGYCGPRMHRWPQAMDELLDDMGLPSMRSGGNWLTWPFKVISPAEIKNLGEERRAKREADLRDTEPLQ